jgi:hypothetical protein
MTIVGVTVAGALASACYFISSGKVPPRWFGRTYSRVALPLYFSVLLGAVTLSFVISGNSLMHHYRTGTVQRETDPVWFWSIVVAQALVALGLAAVAYVNWRALHG